MNDLRFALRQLVKKPAFSIVVVVTLALGLGANTAIFSVVNGVLIRPLPYPEPGRLVAVAESNPGPGWYERNLVSSGNYLDWRDRNTVFADLAAYSFSFGLAALGADRPVEVTSVRVTPNMFDVLGATPALGRPLVPADGVPGSDPVVLLSHATWRQRFGADPNIVGRTVQLEEERFTVAGVMPATFDFPSPTTDVWLPLQFDESDRGGAPHRGRVAGILAPCPPRGTDRSHGGAAP